MFGLLNNSQAYGVQTAQTHNNETNNKLSSRSNNINNNTSRSSNIRTTTPATNNKHHQPRPRSTSSLSDSVRESKIFSSLSSMHAGLKTPTNLIEKFLKTELLNSYENIKNYKNFQHHNNNNNNQNNNSSSDTNLRRNNNSSSKHFNSQRNSYTEGLLHQFNCLQGSYRSNSDSEFYEAINVTSNTIATTTTTTTTTADMTIKCSKNLLAEPPQVQAPATLQNYQKLPDYEQHGYLATPDVVQLPSSGASSGEFNGESTTAAPQPTTNNTSTTSSSSNSFYKRLSFGGNRSNANKHLDVNAQSQANESASENSSSSITTTTTTNSLTSTTTTKSNDLHRSSSASSSGDCVTSARERERKCKSLNAQQDSLMMQPTINQGSSGNMALTSERLQRRKLIQMISNFEQQNKQLQRELAKEKRRRTEELSRVVKSLLCFESKLKTDMKAVNQRLAEKDNEICRLVRQNRALRKQLLAAKQLEKDKICDEGVVVGDAEADDVNSDNDKDAIKGGTPIDDDDDQLMEDCLVLEALQCNNCRKQFYDIELNESCTQTIGKDGGRKNADHNMEHGSSSDDTVSSSFCGARRSVRYTSKRTSGTFRDYMRSRAMNIDDPSLEQNSEENTSTISRDDSQTSYEKLNVYSRTIERMHGLKCDSERESSEKSASLKGSRPNSRCSSKTSEKSATAAAIEEDDGIFSPTQDDDFEEDQSSEPTATGSRVLKIVPRRAPEFSEASPKQIYETSTDDWYASASDQEEIVGSKTSYSQAAVNPVLECVNQILLQQSMEEAVVLREKVTTPKRPQNLPLPTTTNLPRRSSLSGRRNSRNDNSSDPNSPRSGTLTRKRVHFSTKNSMVHVPRNDEVDEDDENVDDKGLQMKMISSPQFHAMPNFSTPLIISPASNVIATDATVETFNYESIYSNEYEPVGSERNSSNLYVDMESALKPSKKPPALPPKPANLIKFKKSLHQVDEVPDEQQDCDANTSTVASEPDYCSISEVNVSITNVQIVAVVHKPPESETADDEPVSELDLEVSTVASDETCGAISQKTDEIEEIFADIPKLPNVAAIIAPKNQIKQHQQQQQQQQQLSQQKPNNDYLIMSPKVENSNAKTQNARRLALNLNVPATASLPHDLLSTPLKSPKVEGSPFSLQLTLGGAVSTPPQQQQQQHQHQQYKRKHMPNILAEINQRLSLPNTPTTPTAVTPFVVRPKQTLQEEFAEAVNDSPLQAEFDWYNLDAEYGRSSALASTVEASALNQPDLLKINDGKLAEIREDHESLTAAADEYNLDEEFSLSSDQQPTDVLSQDGEEPMDTVKSEANVANICESVNFPLYNESSPAAPGKAKKMKKNLANFEKFIEGSGLSTKPLPSKRKIYFAGPYV